MCCGCLFLRSWPALEEHFVTLFIVTGSPSSVCSSRSRTGLPGQSDQRSGSAAGQPGVSQQPAAGGTQPAGSGRHHVRSRRNRPGKHQLSRLSLLLVGLYESFQNILLLFNAIMMK